MDPLTVIASKEISEDELLAAIGTLGTQVHEPPAFWLKIAGDPQYSESHRIRCVFQFFRRHVSAGMKLSQLGRALGAPPWLGDGDIDIVHALIGELPVGWSLDDTLIAIRIRVGSPNAISGAVYIRAVGKISRSDVVQLLRGGQGGAPEKDASICEVGLIP